LRLLSFVTGFIFIEVNFVDVGLRPCYRRFKWESC